MSTILIYQSKENLPAVEVNLQGETLWLSQKQMAEIFGTQIPAVNKHIKNILEEGELTPDATVSKMEIVQMGGKRRVKRNLEVYNLDMVLSIGYRINSQRATQFRIWATQRLKDYLIKGYAINQQRLEQLQKTIEVIEKSSEKTDLQLSEAKGLLKLLSRYTKSFVLLNQFDSSELEENNLNTHITYEISYLEAKESIEVLKQELITKKEATDLFGKEKDQGFKSSLQTIVQTFDRQYPSIRVSRNRLPICCTSS